MPEALRPPHSVTHALPLGPLLALPLPAWVASEDMRRTVFNTAWAERVGRDVRELVGNGWASDIHPADFKGTLDAYFDAVSARESFSLRFRLRRPDGSYGWVLDDGAPHYEGGRFVGYVGVCRDDPGRAHHASSALEEYVARRTAELAEANEQLMAEITTRREAEERLHQSEELFSKAFHAAPFGACLVRLSDHRVLDANESYARLTGFSREDFLAGVASIDHGLPTGRLRALRRAVETSGSFGPVELRIRQRSGKARFALVSAERVMITSQPCALVMALDVTQRKRLEQDLLLASERERRQIAQDLHDDLGQQLTGLTFLTSALGKTLGHEGSPHRTAVEQLESLASTALDHVRRLSRALAPVKIDPRSLTDAFQRLAENTEAAFGIRCTVEARARLRVPDATTATHLYRIAQEAIANAIRHGRAASVTIELDRDERADYLRILNDGLAPPPQVAERGGLGLNSMRYRCETLGGHFSLAPLPERGAVVACTFPRT